MKPASHILESDIDRVIRWFACGMTLDSVRRFLLDDWGYSEYNIFLLVQAAAVLKPEIRALLNAELALAPTVRPI